MAISRAVLPAIIAAVVACTDSTSPATGKAEITLAVSGLDVDPDGFQVMVDGTRATTLAGQGSVTLDLPPGQHSVTIGGLAANCTLQLPVSQVISVSESQPVRIDFAVICTALTGVVKVTAATTGLDADADGYQLTIGANPVAAVNANGAAWIPNVAGGTQHLSIGGLAANCQVAGSNPVDVNVSVGGLVRDTAQVTVSVSCTAVTGVVVVTTATTGLDPDPDGYAARIDGGPAYLLATNGVGPIPGISGGAHNVALEGIAANCHVMGSNPVNVNVSVGGLVRDTARVTFNVTCTKIPRTGADLVVTTTGTNPDDQYHVVIYGSCYYYCYTPTWEGNVPGNGTVELTLPEDSYTYSVTDIANNCSGPQPGSFDVATQQVTKVPLAFTCLPSGTVEVDVHASGDDIQNYYSVSLDGTNLAAVPPGGHISLAALAGAHTVGLTGVTSNCTVAAPNPVPVTVTTGGTVNVSFTVTCVANPIVSVTVTTTGTNAPANYLVGVDPDYYYGYLITASIPSNGTVSIKVPVGTHIVTLDQVPGNCTVTSANNVSITVPLESTTDLAFTVSCH